MAWIPPRGAPTLWVSTNSRYHMGHSKCWAAVKKGALVRPLGRSGDLTRKQESWSPCKVQAFFQQAVVQAKSLSPGWGWMVETNWKSTISEKAQWRKLPWPQTWHRMSGLQGDRKTPYLRRPRVLSVPAQNHATPIKRTHWKGRETPLPTLSITCLPFHRPTGTIGCL